MSTNTQPIPPQPPKRSTGCWHIALAATAIAALLTTIALFLPPFNLADRILSLPYTPLSPGAPAQTFHDDLRLSLPAEAHASELNLRVARLNPARLDPREHLWLREALDELPAELNPLDQIYILDARGGAPTELEIALRLPADLPEHIALYAWNGAAWHFLPMTRAADETHASADFLPRALGIFQQAHAPPIVMLTQELTQDLTPELNRLATIISPAGLQPAASGGFFGSLAPGGRADADYLLMPVLRNFSQPQALDIATLERLLSHSSLRQTHIKQITNLASFNDFAGVFIDYRGLTAAYRERFTRSSSPS